MTRTGKARNYSYRARLDHCEDPYSWSQTIYPDAFAANADTHSITLAWKQRGDEEGNRRHIALGGSYESWTLFDVQVDHSNASIPPVQSPTVSISCTGRQLTISGAEGLPISIYSISGVLLSQCGPTAERVRTLGLQGLPAGVYFVRVGTLPAQKIVLLR